MAGAASANGWIALDVLGAGALGPRERRAGWSRTPGWGVSGGTGWAPCVEAGSRVGVGHREPPPPVGPGVIVWSARVWSSQGVSLDPWTRWIVATGSERSLRLRRTPDAVPCRGDEYRRASGGWRCPSEPVRGDVAADHRHRRRRGRRARPRPHPPRDPRPAADGDRVHGRLDRARPGRRARHPGGRRAVRRRRRSASGCKRGPSASWRVIETLEPCLVPDMHAAGITVRGAEGKKRMQSWLAVPIIRRGRGIGLARDRRDLDQRVQPGRRRAARDGRPRALGPGRAGRALRRRGPGERAARRVHRRDQPRAADADHDDLRRCRRCSASAGELLDEAVVSKSIEDIEVEADRLSRIVEDLLVLSRAERGKVEVDGEPIGLARLVRRVADVERQRSGRAIEVEIERRRCRWRSARRRTSSRSSGTC